MHQEATASSTSSLIWGLKEFTKVVESPTRPWSSLSFFETTPSIQVSQKQWMNYTTNQTLHLQPILCPVWEKIGITIKTVHNP